MKLGNLNLSDIKLGTQQVKKVIFGNNLVWQSISYIIQEFKTRVFAIQGEFEAETCLDTQLTDLDNKGLLDSASFVLTPNAYEEGVLFAVKPDKVGTNLLQQSETFENSYWNKTRCTISTNQEIAPNGSLTADYVVEDSTTGLRYVGVIGVPTIIGQTYTFSVFVKKKDRSQIVFQINEGNSLFPTVKFDFDSQVFTQTSPLLTSSFQSVGNGWFRIILTRTPTIGTSTVFGILPVDANGNYSGIGDGVSRTIIWGAQLELGSTATDYISTTDRAIVNGTIGDLTVTRATLGTRVNANGDIEQVPYNYYSFSEQFDNSYWIKSDGSGTRVTVNPNQAIAPDGNMTADLLIPTTTLIEHSINATIFANTLLSSVALANLLTFSVYVKPAGYNFFIMRNNINNIWTSGVIFNIQTGTIVSAHPSYVSSNITSVGDGWYRLSVTTQNVTNTIFQMFSSPTGAITFSGDGVSGAYIWGAQLVQGTQPKDYFPTTNRFNIPRIDYSNGSCPSILVEQATSNQIRNNSMVGAVIGNPGTLPTNWIGGGIVSSLGVERGIEYIDIRIAITATSGFARIFFEPSTQIVAANGQIWTLSSYLKIIDAPQPPTGYRLRMFENDSTGALVTSGFQTITPTTSFARYSFTRTLSGGATVARVQPILEFTTVSGETYDFTIRVSGPQMEQFATATSLIQTTTAAVTRNADVISNTNARTLIGQTEGSVYLEVPLVDLKSNGRNFITLFFNNSNWVRFRIQTESLSNVNIQTEWYVNNVFVNQGNANIPRSTSLNKILFTYKIGSQVNFFHNGIKLVSTNPIITEIPPFNQINLGASQGQGSQITEGIKIAAIWKTALTDAQAIQLTTL